MWVLARFAALRVMFLALSLPLGAAAAWSGYVEALGGGPVHHCRCAMSGGHSTCSCPLCHPFDPRYRLSTDAFRNKCGDTYDDATHELVPITVSAAVLALRLRVPERVAVPRREQLPPEEPVRKPAIPPPRARAC